MKIIGLTGPSGSGKSTVAEFAEGLGIVRVDCDKVARSVTEKGSELLPLLAESFGDDILINGELDRKLLAKRAFVNTASTDKLNSIMLPFIAERINERIDNFKADGVEYLILDAPTLYESGLDSICDCVIAVLCPVEIRRNRIIARDGLTVEEADVRLKASKSDDFYRERTEHIIFNSGDIDEFFEKIKYVFGEILKQ